MTDSMRTTLFVTLVVIFCGVFDSLMFAAGYDALSEFDGREVVVRIYRKKPEGGASTQDKAIRIKDGAFRLSEDDLAGSYGIEMPSWLQKDPLVKQQVGRGSRSYRPWEGPVFYLPVRQDEFEDRLVAVRMYEHWLKDPTTYRQLTVRAAKGAVRFDFADVNDSAFAVIFGPDQDDELISKVLGRRAFGWAYRKGMEYALSLKMVPHKQQDFRWTFLDALGEPVSNTPVQIYLEQDERVAWVGSSETDTNGTAVLDFCPDTGEVELRMGGYSHGFDTSHIRFVIEHPDYGRSVIEVHRNDRKEPQQTVLVPAVDAGSEADRRSVWGQVVDGENKPLGGLYIQATGFYPLGGDWIGHVSGQTCGALTDAKGRFRMYLPPSEDSIKIGSLIPRKSEYYLLIKPPKQLGLLPFAGRILNGQETTITLERAGSFHTFVFMDANGPITDPNQLREIEIYIHRPDTKDIWLNYQKWLGGGRFPRGRYEARSSGRPWAEFAFEPIEVTADSLQQLVFKVSSAVKVYYGKVVDGTNGEPMEGAFVVDSSGSSSGTNLSTVTGEQWDALHALPNEVSRKDKTYAKVLSDICYESSKLVRTDSNGWFELTLPKKRSFSKVVIFDQNYLTVITDRRKCTSEEDNCFAVPLTRLFPAAKVIVETWAEGSYDRNRPKVWPECVIDKTNNPGWVHDLLACWDVEGSTFMDDIRNDFIIHLNEKESFPVPAGLNMQLQLRPRYGDIEQGWAPMIIAENVNLQQDEILDLGRHQILRAFTILVLVLNSAEQAVEGVPVNACDQYGRQTSNTDENGTALFELAPDAKGRFVVEYDADNDSSTDDLREHKPYEITGPEDANTVYTLRVPDELLYNLFK